LIIEKESEKLLYFVIKNKVMGRGLKKGNNSLATSILTLPGGALKGGGKHRI